MRVRKSEGKKTGGFRVVEMSLVIATDPARAARELDGLLSRHGGSLSSAAGELGVHYRTVTRWKARLASLGHPIGDVATGA